MTKDIDNTKPCLCGCLESSHVKFSSIGDLGFYGCVECMNNGRPRCRFYQVAARRVELENNEVSLI